jgi:hypothetical protein
MDRDRDFLDTIIDERTERNPEFPALVDAAKRRRDLLYTLAREKLSTVERFAGALGFRLEYRLVPEDSRGAPG